MSTHAHHHHHNGERSRQDTVQAMFDNLIALTERDELEWNRQGCARAWHEGVLIGITYWDFVSAATLYLYHCPEQPAEQTDLRELTATVREQIIPCRSTRKQRRALAEAVEAHEQRMKDRRDNQALTRLAASSASEHIGPALAQNA